MQHLDDGRGLGARLQLQALPLAAAGWGGGVRPAGGAPRLAAAAAAAATGRGAHCAVAAAPGGRYVGARAGERIGLPPARALACHQPAPS